MVLIYDMHYLIWCFTADHPDVHSISEDIQHGEAELKQSSQRSKRRQCQEDFVNKGEQAAEDSYCDGDRVRLVLGSSVSPHSSIFGGKEDSSSPLDDHVWFLSGSL